MKIIRSDKFQVHADRAAHLALDETLEIYRGYVRDLMLLINARWPQLARCSGNECVKAIETLIHPTAKRPQVATPYFHRRYYKFPSYLRRVAIKDAFGQVASFHTRYDRWLDGQRTNPRAKPPRLSCATQTFPSLYAGQCLKFSEDGRHCDIKVFWRNDWVWRTYRLRGTPRFVQRGKQHSPLLACDHRHRHFLSVPVQITIDLPDKDEWTGRVMAIDVGINTAATTAVVDASGTVLHREFFPRSDKDREHKIMAGIRAAAKKATGHGAPLYRGFCAARYRRLRNMAIEQAHRISRKIVDRAKAMGCDAVIVEHLKGWRPRAGRKRSTMKMRFHRWFHRRLIDLIQSKAHEARLRFRSVYPRGTSSLAFDGTGKLKRDRSNYSLATFPSGKRYNADLNAAYNIAARGIVNLYYGGSGNRTPGVSGQKSRNAQRSPVTLSCIWALSRAQAA